MATIPISLQEVNGDPFVSGGNINITTSTVSAAVADEDGSVSLSSVEANDTITIEGVTYSYDYLGSHNVNNDTAIPAAYIRIVGPLPSGATLSVGDTFAIDLTGEPGDPDYPNLPNGNTKGTVAELNTTTEVQFPGFVCFAKGSRIRTSLGELPVEALNVGDLVLTADRGLQPISQILHRKLEFNATNEMHKPIEFKANSLGPGLPEATLCVSPQHRILFNIGEEEHLIPAKTFTNRKGVRTKRGCKSVEYFHLVFGQHEIIFSEGLATESFYPGAVAVEALETQTRHELQSIFPRLSNDEPGENIQAARSLLGPSRAKRLMEIARTA